MPCRSSDASRLRPRKPEAPTISVRPGRLRRGGLRSGTAGMAVPFDHREETFAERSEARNRKIGPQRIVANAAIGDAADRHALGDNLPVAADKAQDGARQLADCRVFAAAEIVDGVAPAPCQAAAEHLADIADMDEIAAGFGLAAQGERPRI